MNAKITALVAGLALCAGFCAAEQGVDVSTATPPANAYQGSGAAPQSAAPAQSTESNSVLVDTATTPSQRDQGVLREENPNDQPTPTDKP